VKQDGAWCCDRSQKNALQGAARRQTIGECMHAVALSAYMDTMYAMEDTHWDDDQLGLAWNAAPIMGLLCMERGRGTVSKVSPSIK